MINKEIIKKTAYNFDIDICRITDGSELTEARKNLKKRKAEGYWPQPFTDKDIEKINTPAQNLENLKYVIVVAISYNNTAEKSTSNSISKYVSKKDYHHILREKMQLLIERIADNFGFELVEGKNYKIMVDTEPILERALAERAGAGFIGKNSMLIHPDYGSYIFLGEIFVDFEIESDRPLEIDCGECTDCLKSCEGGALKKSYLVDGESCISYLTQKKGILSLEDRKKIGYHIWGCDKCQQVCPYNQQRKLIEKGKEDKKDLLQFDKDLEYFLMMDRRDPDSELNETAMMWRGSRILIRNAIIAAANLNKVEYYELIKEKLNDNSPIIRFYAAWAAAALNFQKAEAVLKRHLKSENNREVKNEIKRILKED